MRGVNKAIQIVSAFNIVSILIIIVSPDVNVLKINQQRDNAKEPAKTYPNAPPILFKPLFEKQPKYRNIRARTPKRNVIIIIKSRLSLDLKA